MFIAEAAALSDLQPPIARENYPLDRATSLARGFQWTGRGGKMIRKPWKNRSWVQNHGFW